MSSTDATRPDDPAETPGARTYEQREVSPSVQGRRSPGATEPGDIGAQRDEEAPPRERPRPEDGQGYRGG
ncbi:hypothetical protein [Methylobacterium sp. B4]|uniref:hypothetical protein n=1 Tax=Methylobacterium sp. B4 TaxID=1938755 RepID=UPI000D774180|nr:hypothetical protein [Methylobacterium sp. B4]PXW55545.1 hypothetical protein BY998_11829 [Methylobacterium sp. B4]